MALSEDQVKHVAKLSRIALSEDEVKHYTGELNSILGWIEQLQAVDTEGVAPLSSVVDQMLPLRDDVVNDGGKQADILANAHDSQYGCFTVPKVVE